MSTEEACAQARRLLVSRAQLEGYIMTKEEFLDVVQFFKEFGIGSRRYEAMP